MLRGKPIVSELSDAESIRSQLIDLQSQLAFQEDTVQSLNEVVTQQQQQIERLNEMISGVKLQIEGATSVSSSPILNTPPPHY